jgi:carboxyl-terminal processing protease
MNIKKHHKNRFAFYLLLSFLPVTAFVLRPEKLVYASQQAYNRWMILTMVLDKIERFYVETENPDSLIENAIHGMLSGLDSYSNYLSPQEYAEWQKKYQGYQGIGLKYNIIDGKLVVASLIENGPAVDAGVQLGDRIVAIEGHDPTNLKNEEIHDLLKGPVDSRITLIIERKGAKTPQRLEVSRKQILIESIPCAFMLDDSTGYIKLAQFTESTPTELDIAFARLREQGMNRMVFDLRDNGGGDFAAGIEVAERFIPAKRLIIFTKGRTPSSEEQHISTGTKTFPLLPLIVLVNEASASDAEIVAGAIQDWDLGLLAGRKTFGKAMVQTEYPFHDGSALLLTTALYYTPLGRMIQRDSSWNADAGEQTTSHREGQASANNARKSFRTPKGRTLYADGGIMPDIVLEPRDHNISESFKRLYSARASYFFTFARDYVEDHPEIKSDLNSFPRYFQVSDSMMIQLYDKIVASGFRFTARELQDNEDQIKHTIRREIAGAIWGETGRLMINAATDDEIIEAIKHFDQARRLVFE